jgi:hypothetical protein
MRNLLTLMLFVFLLTMDSEAQSINIIRRDYPNSPVIRLIADTHLFQTPSGGSTIKILAAGDSLVYFREYQRRLAVASFTAGFIGFIDKTGFEFTGRTVSGGVHTAALSSESLAASPTDTLSLPQTPANFVSASTDQTYYEALKSKNPSTLTEGEILYMKWVEDVKQTKSQETIANMLVISTIILVVNSVVLSVFLGSL